MEKLLTIAGSDCSGGAGIQADLKTFAAHKAYGMSVITALTAQNTLGVTGVVNTPADFVGEQLDRVFEDIFPDAVKIGMVSEEKIIKKIAEKLKEYKVKNIVLDPVMVSTSGSNLMEESARKALIEKLLPLASIITPNMDEASVLSGISVRDKESMEEAARIISSDLMGAILIKGGHLKNSSDDLLVIDGKKHWIKGERIENSNTHGTGCTLSSAIACNLAKGMDIYSGVLTAKEYVSGAIRDGLNLGRGHGPLNHLYKLS